MKFIFSTKSNTELNHFWLLVYRVAFSAFMLTHGIPKLERLLAGNGGNFPDPLGVGSNLSLILAIFGEVIAPVLVLIGFSTRLSSVPVIITMAVAAFMQHADDPFARKELALVYLIGFLTILIMGGGRYSLDRIFGKGK